MCEGTVLVQACASLEVLALGPLAGDFPVDAVFARLATVAGLFVDDALRAFDDAGGASLFAAWHVF